MRHFGAYPRRRPPPPDGMARSGLTHQDSKSACWPERFSLHRHVLFRPRHLSGKFILRGQAIGFSTLLAIMWLAEVFHVPYHLFGEPMEFVWARLLMRTAVLGVIWAIVHVTTARLLRRLHELEEFLLICSWCRKVGHKGEWLTMEDYFDSKFQTETSHGICPDCARQQLAQHYAATRVNSPSSAQKHS